MRRLWDVILKCTPKQEESGQVLAEPPFQRDGPVGQRAVDCPQPHLCAITDVGRVRDHNEDAYYVSPDYTWFVVADGMGGHEAGEVAADLAIKAIIEHVNPERFSAALAKGDIGSLLRDAVLAAHTRVREANHNQEGTREMGCTLAAVSLVSGLETCHVGDVRCYIQRGDVLHQVTQDHSTVAALVEAGELTSEEARVHPSKNEVLQAIGMPSGVFPDVHHADLASGDRILICSDGLWEALQQPDIESVLASDGTMRQLATQLVDRANSAGGHDNITAILCEVPPTAPTENSVGSGTLEGASEERSKLARNSAQGAGRKETPG
jgi:PPM family protein phosphatase